MFEVKLQTPGGIPERELDDENGLGLGMFVQYGIGGGILNPYCGKLARCLAAWYKRSMKQASATTQKERLYERYGKPFERTHKGEYLAIGPQGQTVRGKRAGEVLREAIKSFGSGNFGLFRIGHATFGEWLVIQG